MNLKSSLKNPSSNCIFQALVLLGYICLSIYSFFHGIFAHRLAILMVLFKFSKKFNLAKAFVLLYLFINTVVETKRCIEQRDIYSVVIYYLSNLSYPKKFYEGNNNSFFCYLFGIKYTNKVSERESIETKELSDAFWIC